jgi:hypothetical protein
MSARIGKLFSDLSENCFRGERKYLSSSELKIMICAEKFLCVRKKFCDLLPLSLARQQFWEIKDIN